MVTKKHDTKQHSIHSNSMMHIESKVGSNGDAFSNILPVIYLILSDTKYLYITVTSSLEIFLLEYLKYRHTETIIYVLQN